MLKNALFGGVNAAVLTAMNADLSIDLDRMAAHCRWLLANGCDGLAVLGTTGEANSLGIQERIELLEGLIARGIPASKMLPGTGTTAIDRHRPADQKGRSHWAAAARCCCRRSITRTRPTTACWPISMRSRNGSAARSACICITFRNNRRSRSASISSPGC